MKKHGYILLFSNSSPIEHARFGNDLCSDIAAVGSTLQRAVGSISPKLHGVSRLALGERIVGRPAPNAGRALGILEAGGCLAQAGRVGDVHVTGCRQGAHGSKQERDERHGR